LATAPIMVYPSCRLPFAGAFVEAERRQVTVLFADMVGFTAFSEKSGEEAAFNLMRSLSKLMDDAVREHGGVVQGFTGDGIMAVFGTPVAFEDAPLRACRAALSILQNLNADGAALETEHGLRPQLRIGLNTGPAVVGQVQGGADGGVTVLGDTVNLAARLQALAEPDAAVLSEATHRLVQGMVEANFAGKHQIKGKSEPQKIYRLDAIRHGVTRFETTVSRGLSAFVGREHELEVLERTLDEARCELRVIDVMAEPGMGKSRLLYEFRQRIGKERAFVLSGSCSPDGQQTPFLPFIEVVRGSFRVSTGETENEVAQKLEMGLTTLGLHSLRNLGLLLHLLGLKAPNGALTGLDGVLIGLRTRELLQQLLEARCQLSQVVMVIEDLHWIDSSSEELIAKLVAAEVKLRLLLVTTRRPEYGPPWLDRVVVTKLHLEPLPLGDIRRLVQSRLGVEALPEALAREVTEKAEGNPLFAEEIVSFLTEQGIIRAAPGKLEFDVGTVAAALPASVQGLLTARVDRLAPNDRALLQAASVIGRRFDARLLASAVGETDVQDRLTAMQALDLVRIDDKSGDYLFKHALVRDALYQTLLREIRTALHLKTAEEIERRSGNRLTEVAEVLAYHYSRTDHAGKAFIYLSMAGSKSLGVYSLDEAITHLTAALALLDGNRDCATDDQIAEFLVPYLTLLLVNAQISASIDVFDRYAARVDCLGDDPRVVLIRHHYVMALISNTRYREAAVVQREISILADRLGDGRSKAYALATEIWLTTIIAPKSRHEFEALKGEAISAASATTDAYVAGWLWWFVGWEEAHQGRINEARDAARELMRIGRQLKDPRAAGFGLCLLSWIAVWEDSYTEALEYSEQALAAAITPLDRILATAGIGCALVPLRRIEEAQAILDDIRRQVIANGWLYLLLGTDVPVGLCKVLQGKIGNGIHFIEEGILRRERDGYLRTAAWLGLFLGEVYLQIIAGNGKVPLPILLRNLPVLLKVILTAPSRIPALMKRVLENPYYDKAGYHVGRAQMILGLFYKAKKKRTLALEHLTEAQRIISQFGQTPMLARIDAVLAELG
jgi:class 3 adenylate cyclase/tetratricopeptide (TPR) repeat protein